MLAPNPLLTSVCVYGPKNQINDANKSSTYKWYLNQLCKYILFWWNLGLQGVLQVLLMILEGDIYVFFVNVQIS